MHIRALFKHIAVLGNLLQVPICSALCYGPLLVVTQADEGALKHPSFASVPTTAQLTPPGVAGSRCQLALHKGRGFPYFLSVLKGSGLFHVQDVMH